MLSIRIVADAATTYHETYYSYNALGERVSELDGITSGTTVPVLEINDGSTQRSMVDSLTVVLPQAGDFDDGSTDPNFTLTWKPTSTASAVNISSSTIDSVTNPSGDRRTWVVTFNVGSTYMDASAPASLEDGEYTLAISGADIDYDADPDTTPPDVSYTFTREYGDYTGGGVTNFGDLVWVLQHYDQDVPAGMWYMDPGGNPNGVIGFGALVAVLQNFNKGFAPVASDDPILQGASQTSGPGSGRIATPLVPREYYYSAEQQILDEYAPTTTEDDSGTPSVGYTMALADQYVWGLAYQNELIERDQTTIGTVTSGTLTFAAIGTLGGITSFSTQRLYAEQDANWNVVALVSTSGTVEERFDYTAYGTMTALNADGTVNNNGDPYGWQVGYQGMYLDLVTGNDDSDSRVDYVRLGIWMTQETNGPRYVDGMNLYWADNDNPVSYVDPMGTDPTRFQNPQDICFAAGTQVLLADGTKKAIENIEVGQMVWACPHDNPDADPTPCRVIEVYHNRPARLLAITIASAGDVSGGAVIRATEKHPFFAPLRGWVAVQDLRPGDVLKTDDGSRAKVRDVRDTGRSEPVFNLRVDPAHTYFVVPDGEARGVLVHNDSGGPTTRPSNQADLDHAADIAQTAADAGRVEVQAQKEAIEQAGISTTSAAQEAIDSIDSALKTAGIAVAVAQVANDGMSKDSIVNAAGSEAMGEAGAEFGGELGGLPGAIAGLVGGAVGGPLAVALEHEYEAVANSVFNDKIEQIQQTDRDRAAANGGYPPDETSVLIPAGGTIGDMADWQADQSLK